MSLFPIPLQVGQGLSANELDLLQPIRSTQGQRFRDRDEYIKSILSDGTAAPEELNVSSLKIAGLEIALPSSFAIRGLSPAFGSFSTNPDLAAWGSKFPTDWKNLLVVAQDFTGKTPKRAIITATCGTIHHYTEGLSMQWRLTINGVEVARTEQTNNFFTGIVREHPGYITWVGQLPAIANVIEFQLFRAGPVSPGRHFIQIIRGQPILCGVTF